MGAAASALVAVGALVTDVALVAVGALVTDAPSTRFLASGLVRISGDAGPGALNGVEGARSRHDANVVEYACVDVWRFYLKTTNQHINFNTHQ